MNVQPARCATFTLLCLPALLRHNTRLSFMHTDLMLEAVPAGLSMDMVAWRAISSRRSL
jgi:hypothetical protein